MFKKINCFLEYFKYLKNPISCLFFKFGLKNECIVKFKDNGYELEIKDVSTMDKLMNFIRDYNYSPGVGTLFKEFDSDKEIVTVLNNIKIYNPKFYPLNDIFFEYYLDYYSNFDIDWENRTIIDIGANSGDSALYFASHGSEVYGFEPVKEYYDMALKNVDLNPTLKNRINLFNKGVSYKNGKINIDLMQSTSVYISDNDSYEVEIISINELLSFIKPDLLKIDCEGCEFEIIENCDLSMFNEIIFEYHSFITGKNYRILANKLQDEGFNLLYASVFNRDIEDLGLIYAYK